MLRNEQKKPVHFIVGLIQALVCQLIYYPSSRFPRAWYFQSPVLALVQRQHLRGWMEISLCQVYSHNDDDRRVFCGHLMFS